MVSFGMSGFLGSMKSTALWRHHNRTEILFGWGFFSTELHLLHP